MRVIVCFLTNSSMHLAKPDKAVSREKISKVVNFNAHSHDNSASLVDFLAFLAAIVVYVRTFFEMVAFYKIKH